MSKVDISGKWELSEQYEHGNCTAEVIIEQKENDLYVVMETHEVQDNAPPFTVKQFLEGHLVKDRMYIRGQRFELLNGPKNVSYELDSYSGKITTHELIEGYSLDGGGTKGTFQLKKITL